MRHRLASALCAAVAAAALLTGVSTALLAEVPVCTGRDVYQELKTTKPESAARIDAAARDTANAGPLLWRVEKPGVAASYLFGTIHLSDDRILAMTERVTAALDSADRVVLEIADLDPGAMATAIARNRQLLVSTNGLSLTTALNGDEARKARDAIEQAGVPGDVLGQLKPWVVTMLMALGPCERRRMAGGRVALDAAIAQRAHGRGLQVLGLETLDDQLRAMASVPDEHQLIMLRAGLALADRTEDLMETLVQLYLARKVGHVWPLQAELWTGAGFGAEALDSFREALLTRRNKRMKEAAAPLLAKGRSFIAVGALHLSGQDGLVQLLKDQGWQVTSAE
jgi:uncharacterized protein YbaP (TraB family)